MVYPFFKPLFQIVLDPPIRDMVNASGKPMFSRGVSYVLAPLAFLIFRKRQIGNGSVLFRKLEQLGLRSCSCCVKRCVIAVCFSLATVILPSLQRCLQRVVAKGANKMAAVQNGRRY
jgi:hypothetical protein